MSRRVRQFLRSAMPAAFFGISILFAVALGACFANAQQAPSKPAPAPAPKGKAFSSPEQAAEAVHSAAKKDDEPTLMVIFGPTSKDMVVWGDDANERGKERAEFARRFEQMHRLVAEPDGNMMLYVGAENWPLPIPLVKVNGSWYFDTEAGKQEIMFRRIGMNELEALEVCHALVEAEQDYYKAAHAYTAKFVSTGRSHDGLYWTDANPKSPIGPYLAHAGMDSSAGGHTPYHGYYYRIFSPAKGSFAIVAFPAEYRSSGVVTFLMDDKGNAYEKDLGPQTNTAAGQINSFAPDSTWTKSE
jgi:Protein of unknown function (DUF2950)